MKSLKKFSILLLALIFTMSMITGCSTKKTDTTATGTDTTNSTNDNNIQKNNSMSIFGNVTAVDSKKITIAVMPGNGMKGGPGGGPGSSGGKQQGNAPSGAPKGAPGNNSNNHNNNDNQQPPQGKGGQQPPSNDNNAGGKAPKTQTKKITITDESIISVQNGDSTTSGSLKDITKGSMIHITYKNANGKKVMSSITVSAGPKIDNNSKSDSTSDSKQ